MLEVGPSLAFAVSAAALRSAVRPRENDLKSTSASH